MKGSRAFRGNTMPIEETVGFRAGSWWRAHPRVGAAARGSQVASSSCSMVAPSGKP